nr:MAG TPA: hypothetical protein [Bacteriophage sp.]
MQNIWNIRNLFPPSLYQMFNVKTIYYGNFKN